MPAAARKVSYRIVFYYIAAAIALSLNVSAADPILEAAFKNSSASYGGAFVLMLNRWGFPLLGNVVNGVGIIAAFGVANVILYVSTRTLYALADEGWAPAIFRRKLPETSVPVFALLGSSLPLFLAFMSIRVESVKVFNFLSEMAATACLLSWAAICWSFLRWRKAHQKQQMEKVLGPIARSRLQPYMARYGLCCSIFLCVFQGYKAFTRGSLFWKEYAAFSWGYTLAPYAVFSGIVILMGTRLLKFRLERGFWSWGMVSSARADLVNGISEPYVDIEVSKWEKWLDTALDKIS